MESSFNINPQWFTNDFLEGVLKTHENDQSLKITHSDITDAVEKGTNYASTMFKVTMEVTRQASKSEKKSIIIKVLPQDALKIVMTESSMFPREIKMFSEILPRMQVLLEEVMPGVEYFGAKYYYSENKIPYVLMLEDLSVSGFKMADRTVGLDFPHSILAMESLGRFHASSIPLYANHPEMFSIFEKSLIFESTAFEKYLIGFVSNQMKGMIETVKKWGSGWQNIALKLTQRLESINDDIKTIFTPDPTDYNVLIHGDLWVNNIMFRYNDVTSRVTDIKIVDYQRCTMNSPAIDLQCFIHTSISNDVRTRHLEDLLKAYHGELTKTLFLLGFEDKVITYEDMIEIYEKKAVFGVICAITGLPFLMTEKGTAQDIDALSKIDSSETCGGTSISKECETVLKSVLKNFEKKGVL